MPKPISINPRMVPAIASEPVAVSETIVDDPVSPTALAVIEVFSDELAKLAFPDVDLAILRCQADEVRVQAAVVARAREALDIAMAVLAARASTLDASAKRGIAYARIYADAHPERHTLVTALAAIAPPVTPPPTVTASGKRRGRPPRPSAELMFAVESPVIET